MHTTWAHAIGVGTIVFGFAVSTSLAETISYALYDTPLPGTSRLIVAGDRTYGHDDVRITFASTSGRPRWKKELRVTDGFGIGASISREPKLDGFALWLAKDGGGFSWEWFDRESGDVFTKRVGNGRLRVRTHDQDGLAELGEIEFLDDIALHLDAQFPNAGTDNETHRMVVKRGSVLWLAR